MIELLQAFSRAITGFIRLPSAAFSGRKTPEQLEMEELREIARGACKYTMSYKGNELSKDYKQREYCKMPEKYFEMFFLLRRGAEECRRCEDDNTRVVGLKYLCGSDSPRKWMNYVIFYSLEKRLLNISDDRIFIGVAIYSQFYNVTGTPKEILIDNLFRLYIRRRILDPPQSKSDFFGNIFRFIKHVLLGVKDSFYNRIYTTKIGRARSEQELQLLEGVMKVVLLAVIKKHKLHFSFERKTGNLKIYEGYEYYEPYCYYLEDWCEKREPIKNDDEMITFSNVVMERVPLNRFSDDEKKILLTLIGMVRTGKNIISVKCIEWLESYDFNDVLDLLNTNSNLVGVAELNSDMKIDKLLGDLRSQLKYLEIELMCGDLGCNRTIEFINSLDNRIAMRVSVRFSLLARVVRTLLSSAKVKYILNLYIPDERDMLRAVAGNPKIIDLELYIYSLSLEMFFLSSGYRIIRDKLRALVVYKIGNLHNEKITDTDLRSLKIETLHIDMHHYCDDKRTDFNQLISRGIVTRNGFKYLVFSNIDDRDRQGIVALRDELRGREWPVILTDFEPPGTENMDYACIRNGHFHDIFMSFKRKWR